jgi:glucokinase
MEKNLALAIDLGATNLRVALVSKDGKILEKIEEKTAKRGKSGKVVTLQILGLAQKILKKNKVIGIGVSSIGPLDLKRGEVVNSPNIPFKKIEVVLPLKKFFGLKIILLNDCTAAVWGEKHFGAGKKVDNLVYITISSGIGGGAIVDGHLLVGHLGNAVEIGHMNINTKYEIKCGCQRKNHWESYASGNNLPKFFKTWAKIEKIKTKFPKEAKEIFERARNKDKVALEFLKVLGKINAKAISNIIVAFAPQLITFGGSVVLNNQDLILKPITKGVEDYLPLPKIIVTPLKENVCLFGAAALVFWPPF